MRTIITRHYPVSKLPEDLREGFDPSALVTVIVEVKDEPAVQDERSDESPAGSGS